MKPRKFKNFEFTGKTERVCFNGWDGKSYKGESEVLPVYQFVDFFKTRLFSGKSFFVPKYTRKWGWTMHEIMYEFPVNGNPTTDFYCEVEEEK